MQHRTSRLSRNRRRPVGFLLAYDEQTTPDSLVIPEDLTGLSDDDLNALATQATEAFNTIYGDDGSVLSEDDLATLAGLTEGIEALHAEQGQRSEAAAERAEQAAALAARVRPEAEAEGDEGDGEGDEGSDDEDEEESEEGSDEEESEESSDDEEAEALVAGSGRREVRVNLSGLRSRQSAPLPTGRGNEGPSMRDVVIAAPDTGVFANGAGLDFSDLGVAVNHRLTSFNKASYEQAARQNRHVRQQFGIASIRKPFPEDLILRSNDPDHVEQVFARAADESRLPGGSLVASGGWCAPSETLYDLFEMESRDGLFSLPEVGVTRGGIRWTQGPDFASLMAQITGFSYTEAQDIAGEYGVDANGVGNDTAGDKPCYKVDCPDFAEARLALDGLCITAGLLQQRGFPEVIARTIRGALVAHDHRMAGRKIAAIAADSTAISMPAGQVGTTAPILTAIELQVEHYREVHRLPRNAPLEAVFPFWVRGAVRSDLSRRLGVDLISVPNSRIDGWFRDAGVNPQFVYNWQGLGSTAASGFTAWPTEVEFLLYAAGTWVGGGSDVITLDTVYDSVMLGQNDYTALFTEEGWLVAKRGHDSRRITVPICPDGATSAGVDIACNGTAAS